MWFVNSKGFTLRYDRICGRHSIHILSYSWVNLAFMHATIDRSYW
ncbi:hypothetical protein [Acinetobacter phage vB_AbaP_ABWU2101]|nr:hypothetical protein [Acinetobacter phage vB_AbaP_ABWU2101]